MNNSKFWQDYNEINEMLQKRAFIQMPGGQAQDKQAQDPAAGGMPPPGMDPTAMGMDPAAMGGMTPPSVDPAAMGGMPPAGMDPAAMGLAPAPTGVPGENPTAPGSPMITISLDQLFDIIQKVLGLAKKVGVNGSGVQQPAQQEQTGLTQDQLKATIYEALGGLAG